MNKQAYNITYKVKNGQEQQRISLGEDEVNARAEFTVWFRDTGGSLMYLEILSVEHFPITDSICK